MSKIEKNLTEGSVVKQLILFALPFMLSNLIQSLYNVADMLIVGRFCGPVGISGVNIGGQVTFLMTNLVIGLSVGGTVVIAQFLGCGDHSSVASLLAEYTDAPASLTMIYCTPALISFNRSTMICSDSLEAVPLPTDINDTLYFLIRFFRILFDSSTLF